MLDVALTFLEPLLNKLKEAGTSDPLALLVTIALPTLAVIWGLLQWIWPRIWDGMRSADPEPVPKKDLFPFQVFLPPESDSAAKEKQKTILRIILESSERFDDPLASFNVPYQQRQLGQEVLAELETCFQRNNWVLVQGRSGLGKTREAAQLALKFWEQGWTILYLKAEGIWLDTPLAFPTERVPKRKLLFFLDDLHQKMYASRFEGDKTQDGVSNALLRRPLQERLGDYLAFFEKACGAEQIRVIATTRNESEPKPKEEFSALAKLELEYYPRFWQQFERYDLPDLATDAVVKVFQTAVEQGLQVREADFQYMAAKNDRTFRNVVENLRKARDTKQALSRQNFQDSLSGSWQDRFQRVQQRYPQAGVVYDAVDLLQQLGIDLNQIEDLTLRQKLLRDTAKRLVQGWWHQRRIGNTVAKVVAMEPQLWSPPDGLLEAKDTVVAVDKYLTTVRQLLLKRAKEQPRPMILPLLGFAGATYQLEKYREALPVYQKLLDKLLVRIEQVQDTEVKQALLEFLPPLWFNRGTAAALIGKELKTSSAPPPEAKQLFLEAIASYDKALEFKPNNDKVWYNRGLALDNLEQFKEAVASYNKALEFKPDDHETWNNRGLALVNLEQFKEAVASYDKALEFKPDKDKVWYNRGIALDYLGQFEEAVASYDKALEFKPDRDKAWYNRGIALDYLGQFEEAVASYDKALEFKPDKDKAWNNRGIVLDYLGQFEEAVASYDKALEFKPDDHETWNNRGLALVNLEQFKEAVASWDKALEFKPDNHETWNNRGLALVNLEQFKEAVASWDKALEFKPDKDKAWYNRGIALDYLGQFEEAVASYDKALEFKPDKDKAWYNRGIALFNLGQFEEAVASYDKVLELKPDDSNTFYNRACTYALQNKVDEAIADLSRAITLNPDACRELAKTDSDFDAIRDQPSFQALIAE